ncbi:hypothetical protein Clacol_002877 [Clathrus columnatus]|uniref:methionine--tRNA ligase n=1 Tax=Clathrus columnatus TaxID=1419009 RepID=A0AAV5A5B2_9AGAM|nr:hypothetical protein Clacol_002877 [Clathrus columnatus]
MSQQQQNIRQVEGLLRQNPKKDEKILPKEKETNVLITSALPYCNNVPHLGTRNRRTLYVCGTDEYGTATETQALKENISPKALCDKYHQLHSETYEWFEIGICQDIYLHLSKNGMLEKQLKDQTFCEGCQRFLADRLVEGTCPNCGYEDARGDQCDKCSRTLDPLDLISPRCQRDPTHSVVPRQSSHMYVKLNVIQPRLEEWIKTTWKTGKWSPNVIINSDGEIIDARLKGGLRPSPVTRDLIWGVPVPVTGNAIEDEEMKDKVLYVWFDAPIGYPSITANYTDQWRQWWFNPRDVKLYQFMEFLNYEGGKFSKSRNRGVFGPAARETGLSPSVWRYYLLSTRPETSDSMFSWNEFITVNNSVLLNNFGNFVNRAIKFVATKYDSKIPDGGDQPGELTSENDTDSAFINEINTLLRTYIEAMDAVKLRLGLQIVMSISARGNLYLQQSGLGNALFVEDPKRCAQVVSRAINLIYALSTIVYPFMPSTSEAILSQLNAPSRTVPGALSNDILPGHVIGTPAHLFKKIDEKQADIWRIKFGGTSEVTSGVSEPVKANSSKKKVAATTVKVSKAAEDSQKSEAALITEAQIKVQGDMVRALKEKKKRQELVDANELTTALAELLRLKAVLKEQEKN